MQGYKVLTHDHRSPIQGGDPIFDGTLPFTLPKVEVDTSTAECSSGWNFCRDLSMAFRIAGLWPNGRPSRAYLIEADDAIERKDKCRASQLTLVREATEVEVEQAIYDMSKPFREFHQEMYSEQIAWRNALRRLTTDEKEVERNLRIAIEKRSLQWKLKRYKSARDARDARGASDASDAWSAWVAGDAWGARAAWDVNDAWDAGVAWDASDTWAAWDALDAWAALTVYYTSRQKWITHPPDLLTVGLREAYEHGLGIAIPTDKNTLGWSMV